jgi:hypothetical protein
MRLLNVSTVELEDFPNAKNRPPYVAVSHIWGPEEISYVDMTKARQTAVRKQGYKKIQIICKLVREQNLQYLFIDVCCLKDSTRFDGSKTAEFSEAINSMFNWFADAELCFAYLKDSNDQDEAAFHQTRWFTRRWTLLEFLAARKLVFFNGNGEYIGDRDNEAVKNIISKISGINTKYFAADPTRSRRQIVDQATIGEKWRWASRREATRIEDMAYSMLGIFGVTMPISYGEKGEAITRLGITLINNLTEPSYSSLLGWADAIWLAARLGNQQLAHYLLENNAEPDAADWKGWTALHYAAKNSRDKIVENLLAFGANPNVQNENGETPLHLAAKHGYDSIITQLLKHAADASITTKQGKLAQDYASLKSSKEIFVTPPIVEWTKVGHGKRERLQLPPQLPSDDERTVCESFAANILYFGVDDDVISQEATHSVYDLIYRDDNRLKRPERATYQWIHLPLNHVSIHRFEYDFYYIGANTCIKGKWVEVRRKSPRFSPLYLSSRYIMFSYRYLFDQARYVRTLLNGYAIRAARQSTIVPRSNHSCANISTSELPPHPKLASGSHIFRCVHRPFYKYFIWNLLQDNSKNPVRRSRSSTVVGLTWMTFYGLQWLYVTSSSLILCDM